MTALTSLITSFAALLAPDPGNDARLRRRQAPAVDHRRARASAPRHAQRCLPASRRASPRRPHRTPAQRAQRALRHHRPRASAPRGVFPRHCRDQTCCTVTGVVGGDRKRADGAAARRRVRCSPRRTILRLLISRVTGSRSGWVRRLRGIGRRPGNRPKGHANRDAALRAGDLAPAIRRADQLPVHCWLAYTRPTRITP